MRSPLQINTSKSTGILKKLIPKGSSVSSFFFYDGTVEVPLASSDRIVVAHTNKYPVFEFWKYMITQPKTLSSFADFLYERLTVPELYLLQDNWFSKEDGETRSALFYILNRCSESGYASCGNINKEKLTSSNIKTLKRLKIKNLYPFYDKVEDPIDGFKTATDTDFLLLPLGKYDHNFFDYGKSIGNDMVLIDHRKIRETVEQIDRKWVIVYMNHPAIFKLYKDKNITMIDKYGNKTNKKERCGEIIINNFVSI